MGFDRRHRRGEVLRHVCDHLDRLDLQDPEGSHGALEAALDSPGVVDTFADDVDLVGALLLRWHARLSARLERALASQPRDLPGAVSRAWAGASRDLPGLRRLVDEQRDTPSTDAMRRLVERARDKERALLARAAGLAVGEGAAAVAAGARLERSARDRLSLSAVAEVPAPVPSATSAGFVQRLRALIPA